MSRGVSREVVEESRSIRVEESSSSLCARGSLLRVPVRSDRIFGLALSCLRIRRFRKTVAFAVVSGLSFPFPSLARA